MRAFPSGPRCHDSFSSATIYTWDPNWGNPASINSTNLIYDALGRMVEQQNGSTYTQMLYSQLGKTAIMNGQTLSKAFVTLPGGATAIYQSTGLAYYRHADWLGSSRLTSTPARGVYSDSAYAPFGEEYAKSGTDDPSFTGQNSDTNNTLYDFTFREHSPSQGRWVSPDPLGLGAANPANPQSWNRYAYVLNNPLSMVDPSGLYWQCWKVEVEDGETTGGCDWFDDPPDPPPPGGCQPGVNCGPPPGSCPTGANCGGGGGGAANNGQKPNQKGCVAPNLAQRAIIQGLKWAASLAGKPVGVGVGGSGAAGIPGYFVGGFVNGSGQIVSDSFGNAALTYAFGGTGVNGQLVTPAVGAGGYFGVQFSVNSSVPSAGTGTAVDFGAGGGTGFGGGADLTLSEDGSSQTSLTLGFGGGGFAGGSVMGVNTLTIPFCHN